jgi:hypothetical protein
VSLPSRSDCMSRSYRVEGDDSDGTLCPRRMFLSYAAHVMLLAAVSTEVNSAIPSLSCCEAASLGMSFARASAARWAPSRARATLLAKGSNIGASSGCGGAGAPRCAPGVRSSRFGGLATLAPTVRVGRAVARAVVRTATTDTSGERRAATRRRRPRGWRGPRRERPSNLVRPHFPSRSPVQMGHRPRPTCNL